MFGGALEALDARRAISLHRLVLTPELIRQIGEALLDPAGWLQDRPGASTALQIERLATLGSDLAPEKRIPC